ncbi:Tetratricopeptide repeat-containing protein [Streptomyces sp. ScaeMP-e48]|uniref:tetratricopeptide repeat protein n=1 Tax=Streptomyces sp. ScaeMP-e48 TaxID=1100823 RepID=UPI000823A4A9|nr:tetratricopeptide repeat protein [Streptomyces sp. ScaeMP-e48]SCK55714.1 Tetratricopeptide repeat-containing protein [Streptomyces sp. ScaeMP-e48]
MTPKVRGGRPWGPIRAENPAARKLAETLRRHVDDSGKTLAVLGGEISMGKAKTGVYLGGKVPTEAFIVALIRATVRPELRERRKEETLALREQALRPVPRTTAGTPAAAGPGAGYAVELAAAQAQQIETYDRLTRTLEQRTEVERAKNNSDKLVMVLLNMIHQLDRRVAGLIEERDQLRAQPRSEALEDAERKLARAEEQEQRARAELRRAEEKQRQAETLEAILQDQLRLLTDELDRLRAGDTTSPLDALPALADELQEHRLSADPVGDDIDAVLARASAVNEEDNTTLNRVTSELSEPTAEVVQDNPPDNPTSPGPLEVGRSHAVSVREARAAGLLHQPLPDYSRTLSSKSLDPRYNHAVSVGPARSGERSPALLDKLPGYIRILRARRESGMETGDLERAEALFGEPLPDHSHPLLVRYSDAVSVGKAGDPEQAAALLQELLPDYIRSLGPLHSDSLRVRYSHAVNVGEAGAPEHAADLFHNLVPDYTRSLGPYHPSTLNTRRRHAVNVGKAGDPKQAADLLQGLLPDYTRVLGPAHPNTLNTRYNHAVAVRESDDPEQAAALFHQLIVDYTRALGADHPDTLHARAYRRRNL